MMRGSAIGVLALIAGAGVALGGAGYRAYVAAATSPQIRPRYLVHTDEAPSAATDEARLLDSLAARRDSVLGLGRFAVLAAGSVPQEFEVRAFAGRSLPESIGADTVLVRVVQLGDSIADTLSARAGQPLRVRTPALLILDRRAGRFSVSTGHPGETVELRATRRPASASGARPLWRGPIHGWQMILRRTEPMGAFEPVAEPRALRVEEPVHVPDSEDELQLNPGTAPPPG